MIGFQQELKNSILDIFYFTVFIVINHEVPIVWVNNELPFDVLNCHHEDGKYEYPSTSSQHLQNIADNCILSC